MRNLEQRLANLERRIPPAPKAVAASLEVPNIIDFVVSPRYLNRPKLYPRQATLLKIIFQADDLFTDFDHAVIDEWESGFRPQEGRYVGGYGIAPNTLERIRRCKEEGRSWFREVAMAVGRRGGKGYLGCIAVSHVLWSHVTKGDARQHYGIARDKVMTLQVFAGNKDQARDVFWRDLHNMITGAPCFQPYLAEVRVDKLTLWSPAQLARGLAPTEVPAFEVVAKESTEGAGRGPSTFAQVFDEMAHVVPSGPTRSADAIFGAANPSMREVGLDGFTYMPSSPRFMTGVFYERHYLGLRHDNGIAENPEILSVQLPSWDLYRDWEVWADLELYPGGPKSSKITRALVAEDDPEIQRARKTNPELYRVEDCAQWAEVGNPYLERDEVEASMEDFDGRRLEMQYRRGSLRHKYVGHVDLSEVGANTALVIAHGEPGEPGRPQVVVDLIEVLMPKDFVDGKIKLSVVEERLKELIREFRLTRLTFDHFQSASMIENLTTFAYEHGIRCDIRKIQPNQRRNREIAEGFKAALYDRRVHIPFHRLARDELLFLTDNGHKIEPAGSGPVTTMDIVDCLFEVNAAIHELEHDPGRLLSKVPLGASGYGYTYGSDAEVFQALRNVGGYRYRRTFGARRGDWR